MPSRATSHLAALTGIRQVRAIALTDQAAAAVDAAIVQHWESLLASLDVPMPLGTRYRYVIEWFRQLPLIAAGVMRSSWQRIYDWGYETERANIADALPADWLVALAAGPPIATREARQRLPGGSGSLGLSAAGRFTLGDRGRSLDQPGLMDLPAASRKAEYTKRLFPAPPVEVVRSRIDALIAPFLAQPRKDLVPPEHLANLVVQGYAAGKNRQQIARELLPAVQGAKASATRVARTWGMHVANQSQADLHAGLGDMILGYQIHARRGPYTRSWHAARDGTVYYAEPGPGQKGYDQLPHPPREAADPRERPAGTPTIAWNCRCWKTPVLRPPAHLVGDSAKLAVFGARGSEVTPDPAVYSDWFARTSDRERRLAVGAKRYDLVRDLVGHAPSWAHFVNPDTGSLLSIADLWSERPEDRHARTQAIAKAIVARRQDRRTLATYGFFPPSRPPAAIPASLPAVPPQPPVIVPPGPAPSLPPFVPPTPAIFGTPEPLRALPEATRTIVDAVATGATTNQQLPDLIAKTARQHRVDPHEIRTQLHAAFARAELTMNFAPHLELSDGSRLADKLSEEPKLKNLFEVRHLGAGLGAKDPKVRNHWERLNFGKDVSALPDADRPKYGAVNWENAPEGAAPRYGSGVFVLRREALAGRVTIAPANSSGTKSHEVATLESPLNALIRSWPAHRVGLDADYAHIDVHSGYTELHVWGELPLSAETIAEIRLSREDDPGSTGKIEALARRLGIPVRYY